ncbi:DEAD/DEAH box helicase [Taklimakanibacter lacteus]|uniref:DEAD/DEAH box helicase n=1 Tax=Taklimakanibacter lacteus TaxID=2268456 RepID=UPI000E66CE6B
MTFLPTSPQLAQALAERSYTDPTPVQAAVLADAAVDRDLLVSAQTGSGKTVAYGLSIAKNLLGETDRFERGTTQPLALIVAPTRELALQVQRELAWLYHYTGARIVSCVGGMDPRREQRELAHGAHIVVGTPGRLCDHLRRGHLDVSELKAVVLDEADEMLDLGFREDLEFILKTTPDTRRTVLFSATLPRGIVALARQYQRDAFRIEVAGGDGGHADIEYRAIRIVARDVEHAVVNVLRYFESPGAIVFCNTRNTVRHLQAALLERGFSVVALSGELTQNERTNALQSLRDGRARVCVATDVAARGIDLPNVGLVIHADLPNDPETLQHRSGRTGRAGRKGVSVLLVPPARRRRTEAMLVQAGIEALWGTAPQSEDIRKLDQQRMLQGALFTGESSEDDLTLARTLLAERSPEEIATALARLYRSRLPSPEDIIDPGQDTGRSRSDRGERREARARSNDNQAGMEARRTRPEFRRSMAEGSVWFRLSVGRKKNAEARWLLPMICRRGGIGKQDIGAIRIYGTHSEFEISGQAAERFSENLKRPDQEENIRIEALPGGPQGEAAFEKPAGKARGPGKAHKSKAHKNDKPRHEQPRKHHGEAPKSETVPGLDKKQRHGHKPGDGGRPPRDHGPRFGKPAFGKKPKKKKNKQRG